MSVSGHGLGLFLPLGSREGCCCKRECVNHLSASCSQFFAVRSNFILAEEVLEGMLAYLELLLTSCIVDCSQGLLSCRVFHSFEFKDCLPGSTLSKVPR